METKLPWGYNMIRVSVKFWTDNLPRTAKADDKTAWAKGVITLPTNSHRGIKSDLIHFNNIDELMPKLKELLKRNDIKLAIPTQKIEFIE